MTTLSLKRDPAEAEDLAVRIDADIRAKQHPAGSMGLPALLDERRLICGIPNEAFDEMAAFDRIYVWQLNSRHHTDEQTYAGTRILLPQTAKKRERQESCRGVLVSAGLRALDNLKSNGIELGSIVSFIRFGPWHKPIATFAGGHEVYLIVLRDGDLIGCEDTKADEVESSIDEKGLVEHRFRASNGASMRPTEPFADQSY